MDHKKGPRLELSERRQVSERKRKANRENAQKSTGPQTRAGKEKAKMNAVKHGLSGDDVLITAGELKEAPEEFAQLLTGLHAHYKSVGVLEDMLVLKIARCLWKDRRAQRYEAGAIQRQNEYWRAQETSQNEERFKEALAAGESLESSARGIRYLLNGLDAATEHAQRGEWSTESSTFLAEHFPDRILLPPAPEKPIGSLPDDVDRKQLIKELKAQRDRLRERLPEVEATEKREGDARVRSYTLPDAQDLDRMLRYGIPIDKQFHRTMVQLRQVQADRRAAEAAAAAGGDRPAAH
jgi:hypothetical protein